MNLGLNISGNPQVFHPSELPKMVDVFNFDRDENTQLDIPPSVSRFNGILNNFDFKQNAFIKQPILNDGALNGRDTLTFNVACDQILATNPNPANFDPRTLIIVMKLNSHIVDQPIMGRSVGVGNSWFITTTDNAGELAMSTNATDLVNTITPGLDTWFIFFAMFDNNNFCRMQLNNNSIVTTVLTSPISGTHTLGGRGGANTNDIDLAEYMFYGGDIFADNLNNHLYRLLKVKYGL